MRLSGRITGASIDFATGRPTICFEINEKSDFKQMVDDLKDKEKLSIEVKPYREKRSLDANAYFFVLADKLAEKTGVPKETIYQEAVKNIGGVSEVVCVKNNAVERLCEAWRRNGLGWQVETLQSKIEGCTNVILYYGSSTYNTEQMSRLIDNIVQDCKAVGIETMTPDQLAEMKARWNE